MSGATEIEPDDADALAQIKAERAFLNGASSRVQDGYDPGPRLRKMLLIAQDPAGDNHPKLEPVADAYENVVTALDDPALRIETHGSNGVGR